MDRRKRSATLKRAALVDVQAKLPQYVKASARRPVLIVSDGKPVAVLVGLTPATKGRPMKLRKVLEGAWKEFELKGGIAHEEFWEQLAKE